MTYIELQKEVNKRQQEIKDERADLPVRLVSDMPLQPWFELYLQREWAKEGRRAVIERVPWEQRHEQPLKEGQLMVAWPSRDVASEMDPEREQAGIWIDIETASEPIRWFYGCTQTEKQTIRKRLNNQNNSVIDLEQLMLRLGYEHCMAEKEQRWGDRYSRALQEMAARQVVRLYETRHGRRKKCVVLDCDGVLWGGIISEDGIGGITLSETGKGAGYQRFQKLLKQLARHGIVLAICSKNDETDVRRVFQEHSAMILEEQDILAWSVNWQPKSQQIAALAEQLQIDPADMVLVDDSQWELAEVQSQHPKVDCVWFQPKTILQELAQRIRLQPEDANEQNQLRLQTYRDQQKRQQLRQESNNYEEFLEKLNTQVQIRPAGISDLPRISDLSRRVNQCTNGVRYTTEELQKLQQQGYQLQAVFVSDIYRDLGLVGCIGIRADEACLDLFCLSCRALGRRVEQQLLAALPQTIQCLRWIDTGKNAWLGTLLRQQRDFT